MKGTLHAKGYKDIFKLCGTSLGKAPFCSSMTEPHWTALGGITTPTENQAFSTSALLAERAQIPTDTLQNLVESRSRSVAAVIAAKGGPTLYWCQWFLNRMSNKLIDMGVMARCPLTFDHIVYILVFWETRLNHCYFVKAWICWPDFIFRKSFCLSINTFPTPTLRFGSSGCCCF